MDNIFIKPMCIYRDVHDLFSLFSNNDIAKYSLWNKHTKLDDTIAFLLNLKLKPQEHHFVIRNEDTFLGICNIKQVNDSTTIGYYLLPKHWGKGYATITAKKLLDLSFNKYNAKQVIATCDPNNKASENVMKRIGMTFSKLSKNDKLKEDGTLRDSLIYTIDKVEYINKRDDNKCLDI